MIYNNYKRKLSQHKQQLEPDQFRTLTNQRSSPELKYREVTDKESNTVSL